MDLPVDKDQAAMIDSFTVQHCEHVSQRSFEDVVAAFEAELGSVEDPAAWRGWRKHARRYVRSSHSDRTSRNRAARATR